MTPSHNAGELARQGPAAAAAGWDPDLPARAYTGGPGMLLVLTAALGCATGAAGSHPALPRLSVPPLPLPSCGGYVLPNGICVPAAGVQGARVNAPPVNATLPGYLAAPPAAINISVGRQLFVDSFLLLDPSTTRTTHHQARWLPQSVMQYDEPWESWPLEDHEHCAGAGALVTSRPYSGGLWAMADGTLRLYYLCPGKNATGPEPWARLRKHRWTGGLCLAVSSDAGKTFTKPKLPVFPGTNIVLPQVSDGITVWRDDAAGLADRWVAAAVPESNACMAL